jgi:hypothetical protein
MIRQFLSATRKRKANAAWKAAHERVRDAESRGDDRDLGKARMQLQEATTAMLRAETVKVIRR